MPDSTTIRRRDILGAGLAVAAGTTLAGPRDAAGQTSAGGHRLRISLSGYSLRKYLGGGADKATMTIDEFIDFGANLGLDAVEPTSYYIYRTDKAYLHGLKARAFRRGLEISGTAIGNNFCLPEGKALDTEMGKLRQWVDGAVAMGAPHIRVFAGRKTKGGEREQDFAWMVAAMRRAVEYAASQGVFLGIENHGYLTENADAVLRIVEAVPSPWFGVSLDTGNFKDDGYAQIAKLAPKSVNCQMKADVAEGGKKQPVDIGRVFGILRKGGYHGYVALEYEGKDEPKAASARYLQEMLALAVG